MRQRLIEELCKIAQRDSRVVFLTADLGYGVLDKFAAEFPSRFFNVGVAEQSLIATATGLAEAGYVPYCYSIATFASLRGVEFIRNGPVAHRLPVRIIGIGPGMDYGFDGLSHYAVDDVGSLRCQPGLTIWTPSDEKDISSQISFVNEIKAPVYMRILKNGVDCSATRLTDKSPVGASVTVLSLGDAHPIGNHIFGRIQNIIPDVSHQIVTILGETTNEDLLRHLSTAKICVVAENHYVVGGLASLVSEIVANNGLNITVVPVGVNALPIGRLGDAKYLAGRFMTDIDQVIRKVELQLKV
jgi:transketolase